MTGREKLAQAFNLVGNKFTLDELVELTGLAEISVKTYISDFKNPTYSEGHNMIIESINTELYKRVK